MTKKELNIQIGVLVGEKIVDTLPTLSTDPIKGCKEEIIQVSGQLTNDWEIRKKYYKSLKYDTKKSKEVFQENLNWYRKNIENKHLKHKLKILFCSSFDDKEAFLSGVNWALWDCDFSHYSAKKVITNKYSKYILLETEIY